MAVAICMLVCHDGRTAYLLILTCVAVSIAAIALLAIVGAKGGGLIHDFKK